MEVNNDVSTKELASAKIHEYSINTLENIEDGGNPLSLLPLLSKLFEKIIHYQTQKYLDENNILYKYKSGFRWKYSTDTCLYLLNNKVVNGFYNGRLTGMILIDLQKAFDTIDHEIFLTLWVRMTHICVMTKSKYHNLLKQL